MGNRALITLEPLTKENKVIAIYVHWNGGLESVQAIADVCKARDFRDSTSDKSYALARFIGVWHEFFGVTDGLSLGVYMVDWKNVKDSWLDNGVYTIGKDWKVTEHYTIDPDTDEKIELLTEVPPYNTDKYEKIKNTMIEFGKKIEKIYD